MLRDGEEMEAARQSAPEGLEDICVQVGRQGGEGGVLGGMHAACRLRRLPRSLGRWGQPVTAIAHPAHWHRPHHTASADWPPRAPTHLTPPPPNP
jgi:hypothetical protein